MKLILKIYFNSIYPKYDHVNMQSVLKIEVFYISFFSPALRLQNLVCISQLDHVLMLTSCIWHPSKLVAIVLAGGYYTGNHSSVQFSRSVMSNSATPWIAARQVSWSITNSRSSLRLNVHRVSDAIQPSHPLLPPSPPAPNPSQHQSLFQWVNSLHEVAKVLEFQL